MQARTAMHRGDVTAARLELVIAQRLRPLLTYALLTTHLPFSEIAAELFLSRNTVKSQAVSIYRKLGAATRSQAVARARGLGLLEG